MQVLHNIIGHFGSRLASEVKPVYSKQKAGMGQHVQPSAGGQEDNTLGSKRSGHQMDLTTTWTLSPKWSLGLNASEKMLLLPESNRTIDWKAAALYVNYTFSDHFGLSARGEVFDDADGVIFGIADNKVMEFTLAGNIKVEGFTLIPEVRLDSAAALAFHDGKDGLTKTVASGLIAAVYKF